MSTSLFGLVVLFPALLLFASSAVAQTVRFAKESERTVEVGCVPDFVRLRWSGGRFLAIERNQSNAPIVCTTDRDGAVTRWPFEISGASYIFIYDAAGHEDGTTALVGSAVGDNSRAITFVARISANRTEALVTRLDSYVARKVVIVPNGEVWTVGWIANERKYVLRDKVFKRFDITGRAVGTWAVSASFQKGLPASVDAPEFASLKASSDRVGYLTPGNEYFEFALDGSEVMHIAGPPLGKDHRSPVTLAISSNGQVVVGSQNGFKRWDVWSLNRSANQWLELPTRDFAPQDGELLGFDRETLIASVPVAGTARRTVTRLVRDGITGVHP